MTFSRAITRLPGENFDHGITTSKLGKPDIQKALLQHERYGLALQTCGLDVITLPAEPEFPDAPFVEDTAVLTESCAILTQPGAESRVGEADAILPEIERFFEDIHFIHEPGTLDGGDVCQVEDHFFIGISRRTNESGAQQLKTILTQHGYSASFIDIRHRKDLLHLKSGMAYLGEEHLLCVESLMSEPSLSLFKKIMVSKEESYAANIVCINQQVLMVAGFPAVIKSVRELGYTVIELEMSEFQKMDGGLSCLSLRF